MFISLIVSIFGWLPLPLRLLVGAVFVIFSVFVAISLIKMIFTLIDFGVSLLTGILGKIVSLFI